MSPSQPDSLEPSAVLWNRIPNPFILNTGHPVKENMPNPSKSSPRQFPTVAVVVPRMQVPSTAAPPQGSDPSKSKNVKPDPAASHNIPSTAAPSAVGAMSNPVNLVNDATSAVGPPPQPKVESKEDFAMVVDDGGVPSAEISESEMQLVSSLAKLQKLEAMVCTLPRLSAFTFSRACD